MRLRGRGYLALAAWIFANRKSFRVLMACLLLGFLDALSIRLQSVNLGIRAISVQIVHAFPYILTDVLLAGFAGRAVPPKAGGIPYTQKR